MLILKRFKELEIKKWKKNDESIVLGQFQSVPSSKSSSFFFY